MTPRELVQNHIIRIVNLDSSEIAEIFQPEGDYENACMSAENREFHVNRDTITDKYFWWEAYSIDEMLNAKDRLEEFSKESLEQFPSEQAAWKNCAESNGIEPSQNQTLEVWLISDWLYGKLEGRNESIQHWKGLPLWCKTVNSYPLHEESVVERIAAIS